MAHEYEGNMVNEFDCDLCNGCPECGCHDTVPRFDNFIATGYRVCVQCSQEWWTDIDYGEGSIFNQRSKSNVTRRNKNEASRNLS